MQIKTKELETTGRQIRRTLVSVSTTNPNVSSKHYIVSSTHLLSTDDDDNEQSETLVFRCDSYGDITDYKEVLGRMYVLDHEGLLLKLTQKIQSGELDNGN